MTFELVNPEFGCKKEIKDFIYVPKKGKKERNAETQVLGVKPPVAKKACGMKEGLIHIR